MSSGTITTTTSTAPSPSQQQQPQQQRAVRVTAPPNVSLSNNNADHGSTSLTDHNGGGGVDTPPAMLSAAQKLHFRQVRHDKMKQHLLFNLARLTRLQIDELQAGRLPLKIKPKVLSLLVRELAIFSGELDEFNNRQSSGS